MKKKSKKSSGLSLGTWLLIGAAIGGAFAFAMNSSMSRDDATKVLVEFIPTIHLDTLAKFDEGFVIAWAQGVKSKATTFPYNGKMYSTSTGKSILVAI
jgi:hypothetical protein